MSINEDLEIEYFNRLIDRYTAFELAELLDLDTMDIIDAFQGKVLKSRYLQEQVGINLDLDEDGYIIEDSEDN